MSKDVMADDHVSAFQIDGRPIRGRVTRMGAALDGVLCVHDYPEAVARLLGEALMIGAIVARALKFEGRLVVQAQSKGPVPFVVADCSTSGNMRGYARYNDEKLAALLKDNPRPGAQDLLPDGTFAMTIDQGPDMDTYQGLAAIEGDSLSASAEHYFKQSEQVPTRLRLAVGEVLEPGGKHIWRGGGIMVQRMAADDARGETEDAWETAKALFDTVSDEELLDPDVDSGTLLFRLFHEEGVRLAEAECVQAKCSCSRERLGQTLHGFDKDALAEMWDDGKITATCEFCLTDHVFLQKDFG